VKRGALARDVLLVALIKACASAVVLATGFRAVSDDDFARVVIAQTWAHTPRLDPSGTSWLPFPFWLQGAVLAITGRSLDAARATSLVLGLASALLVYLAARWITRDSRAALCGAALAAIFPWSARLGVATVPELLTAALTLLALASLVPRDGSSVVTSDASITSITSDASIASLTSLTSRRLLGGLALLAATLSRYEPWPVAVGFALLTIADARRTTAGARRTTAGAPRTSTAGARRTSLRARLHLLASAALALAGPAAWIAWNHHAHGEALHFLTRVAAYKKALGAGSDESALTRFFAYPTALVREEPELFALLAVLLALAWVTRLPVLRSRLARFTRPLLLVLAQIAALSLAMVNDGAPTHHPERAVFLAMLLAALIAGDLAASLLAAPATRSTALAAMAITVLLAALVIRPRITADESFTARANEVAIGRVARARTRSRERVLIEVADYGHLAIVAALGRPEDAELDRSIDPRDPSAMSSFDAVHALLRRLDRANASWAIARPSVVTRQALRDPLQIEGKWALFEGRP
jgi:Dolichyl-phosphate-mannose-protein mannosyltransferase